MKAYIVRRPGAAPWFEATQAEAKALVRESSHGSSFEKVDTGANAEAQLAFLNDFAHRTFGEGSGTGYSEAKLDMESGDLVVRPKAPPPDPAPVARPSPVDTSVDAIEAAIGEASPAALARYMIAAIEQLAVTGQPAVNSIRAFIDRQRPAVFFSQGSAVLALLALGEIATGRKVS
jgi:hypothetical protein